MRKAFKWFASLSIVFIAVFVYTGTYLDIPRKELEAKYASGTSQFLNLPDGTRIHYRDEGKFNAPVILLVHGTNGSLLNFERLVPYLMDNFRLVSLDLPGFGLTGAIPSKDYSIGKFMDIISEVTNHLGIDVFSIAGNSMGGHVAWRYAIDYPDKIENLILIASGGVRIEEDIAKLEQAKDNSPIVWRLMNSSLIRKILTFYTPKFFATQGLKTAVFDPDVVTQELASQFHDLALLVGSREAILSMMRSRHRIKEPKILSNITAPTLLIHGEKDNIINVKNSRYFKENITDIEIKIYSSIGHLPMYEDPKMTANDIKNFIQKPLTQ
tara:strand:+ start:96 stop:1073 length:978 start_codon:yes stop_codon:yes gene_type:complete